MNRFTSIFGLIAGLLVQLSVMQPYLAVARSCETKTKAACCCPGEASCCCPQADASKNDRPFPAASTDQDLKQFVSIPDGRVLISAALEAGVKPAAVYYDAEDIDEFAGVPRAVVFCRFLI